ARKAHLKARVGVASDREREVDTPEPLGVDRDGGEQTQPDTHGSRRVDAIWHTLRPDEPKVGEAGDADLADSLDRLQQPPLLQSRHTPFTADHRRLLESGDATSRVGQRESEG